VKKRRNNKKMAYGARHGGAALSKALAWRMALALAAYRKSRQQ